ncbi:MAG: hypothetical protein PHE89_04990 [Alphaproteobacteria bacterium]|nr:hypothetical protein [Alphaproteobacteria bacterium]
MNTQKALELLEKNGGDIKKIPTSELFGVLKALQGNFIYGDTYKQIFDYLNESADKRNEILKNEETRREINDILKFDASSLEDLTFKRDVTMLFEDSLPKRNKLDTQIVEMLKAYPKKGINPTLYDIQNIKPLLNEIDDNVWVKSNNSEIDKATVIEHIQGLENMYLLEAGVEKWPLVNAQEVAENVAYLEKLQKESKEKDKAFQLISSISIDNALVNGMDKIDRGTNEWLPSAKYHKEAYDFVVEEATRKLALDPTFQDLKDGAKTEAFAKAKEESAKDYIRQLMVNQFAYDFASSFKGSPSKEQMIQIEKSVENLVGNVEAGKTPKTFKVNKEIALATLNEHLKHSTAVATEVLKRINISSFYVKAKARQEKFAKDHPFIYNAGKNVAISGAIIGVTALSTTVGSGLAVAYGAQKTFAAYKAMKTKFVNDPLYKGKSFTSYMKDHKLETGAVLLTGAMAAFPAYTMAQNLVSGLQIDKAAISTVRASTVLALGVTNATNQFIKAKTKKQRLMSLVTLGASVGAAGAALFLPSADGQELISKCSAGIKDFFGIGGAENVAVVDTNYTTPVDTTHVTTPVDTTHVTTPVVDTTHVTTPVVDTTHVTTPVVDTTHVTTPVADTTHVTAPVADATHSTPEATHVEAEPRADIGQGDISNKDWARIQQRSLETYGSSKVNQWYANIDGGQIEAIPEGMSKEEFIYKLGQLQKLGPVVHKESINLMLRDLNCEGTVLTTEEIAKVHGSLKTIDIKGEYHGYEPTARTCNRVLGIEVDVNCEDGNVKISQNVEYGDCNKPAPQHEAPEPVAEPKKVITPSVEEPVVRHIPAEEPVTKEVPAEKPVTRASVPVETPVQEETVGEKIVNFKGTITSHEFSGKGNETLFDKGAEKGMVGNEYHGENAVDKAEALRIENEEIVLNMYKNGEIEPFFPEKAIYADGYKDLVKTSYENQDLVRVPYDPKTGTILSDGVDANHEDFAYFVKKGSALEKFVNDHANGKANKSFSVPTTGKTR